MLDNLTVGNSTIFSIVQQPQLRAEHGFVDDKFM